MNREELIESLVQENNRKIVLLVMDGVGGIANKDYGNKTALEYAKTPNLDRLAQKSVLGRLTPVMPGVTPGSGPGHLGLFGYDPVENEIGRGMLEAAGIEMDIQPGDLAMRCNFASADPNGVITDRRAGRISTEKCEELCALLSTHIQKIEDVEVFIRPSMQHRFVVLFRGEGLSEALTDSDPLLEGKLPLPVTALHPTAERSARLMNLFFDEARAVIKELSPANSLLMRGFSLKPNLKSLEARFKLNPICIASYPMYRGLAKLAGMQVIHAENTPEAEFRTYLEEYRKYNFFFIHIKYTDSYGEDGNFEERVKVIEKVDAALPILFEKAPDVLCITGDHSTPSVMHGHSWHPVPVLIHSEFCGMDDGQRFTENQCNIGGLGVMESKYLMNVLLANAGKLKKFGA